MCAASSLDDLVGAHANRLRDRQAERLRRLEIDYELELGGLLDEEVGGLGALENLVHKVRGAPVPGAEVRPVAHESPGFDVLAKGEHGRKTLLQSQFSDPGSHLVDWWTRRDGQRPGPRRANLGELIGQRAAAAKVHEAHLQTDTRSRSLDLRNSAP